MYTYWPSITKSKARPKPKKEKFDARTLIKGDKVWVEFFNGSVSYRGVGTVRATTEAGVRVNFKDHSYGYWYMRDGRFNGSPEHGRIYYKKPEVEV